MKQTVHLVLLAAANALVGGHSKALEQEWATCTQCILKLQREVTGFTKYLFFLRSIVYSQFGKMIYCIQKFR
jgi:hypothetical protein